MADCHRALLPLMMWCICKKSSCFNGLRYCAGKLSNGIRCEWRRLKAFFQSLHLVPPYSVSIPVWHCVQDTVTARSHPTLSVKGCSCHGWWFDALAWCWLSFDMVCHIHCASGKTLEGFHQLFIVPVWVVFQAILLWSGVILCQWVFIFQANWERFPA